jgi:hypothetical protein
MLITHLVKVISLMALLSLALPGVARADTCEVARAVYEPTGTRGVFALRASEDQGQLLWHLVIQKTGETFPFRTETDTAGQTWLVSLPRDGEDPGIRTTLRMLDGKGTETQDRRAVSGVAVFDFWRVLSEYRTRKGQRFEPETNPPANVWDLTECRAK